jgi:hypothetical protein
MSSDDAIVVKNNRSLTPMLIMRPTPDGGVDVQVGEGWTMTEACREFLDTIKRLNAEARGSGGTTETTDTKDEKEANEDEA